LAAARPTFAGKTSTGNCLEVAKKIGGKLISIPAVLKKVINLNFEDDIIGIVILNYGGYLPSPVKEFLRVKLKADYIFGILTYGAFNSECK
jgi:hypothetical protein